MNFKNSYLRCDCLYDVITTPTLLRQWLIVSCCIDALDDIVPRDAPPTDPRGVVYIEDAISSSLSENRLFYVICSTCNI